MKKTLLICHILSLCLLFGLTTRSVAQNVSIPNAAFKAILLADQQININGDNEIQVSEAATFTGTITASGQGITDLTGIEAFTKIRGINLFYNSLTHLDVSANTSLEYLNCQWNQLTALDVSANTALKQLICSENQLSSLDLSQNTALENLDCHWNNLSQLDL
ncbi:MAG: hypothetical protein ACM3O8_12895, partial [Methylococcaceae bacterium]